ncbi:MAG: hypothetical protein ACR2NZ_15500 [Rubripirellula sp.]
MIGIKVTMDELRISSDICEEAGFPKEAKFLKQVADESGKAFVVVERGFEYNDEIYDLNDAASPRRVFLNKTAALREAEARNVQKLREFNPLAFCYAIEEISSHDAAELSGRISEILGTTFRLPSEDDAWELEPIFPHTASDEQLAEIFRLFDRLAFFQVIESNVSI